MAYCYRCGRETRLELVESLEVPACAEHGLLWQLLRYGVCGDVIIERAGRILLMRRLMEPFAGYWATVGGFINPGEHPADAARREAREEVGLTVSLTGLLGLYVDRYTSDGPWTVTATYVGRADGEPVGDPAEVAEIGWFGPQDVPDVMVASPSCG